VTAGWAGSHHGLWGLGTLALRGGLSRNEKGPHGTFLDTGGKVRNRGGEVSASWGDIEN